MPLHETTPRELLDVEPEPTVPVMLIAVPLDLDEVKLLDFQLPKFNSMAWPFAAPVAPFS